MAKAIKKAPPTKSRILAQKQIPQRKKEVTALIFDTETTGLRLHANAKVELQPRIIELGCLLINSKGKVLEEFDELIYPGCEISEEITKITGITNADLAGRPRYAFFDSDFRKLLSKATGVIAHNLPFDTAMVEHEVLMLKGRPVAWPTHQFCTVQENVALYGRRVKLKWLYERCLGKVLEQKHRALDDCHALAEIVIAERYLDSFT